MTHIWGLPFTQYLASVWGRGKMWALVCKSLPKLLVGVALSARYKGTLCASDLLLLPVMASLQNEVSYRKNIRRTQLKGTKGHILLCFSEWVNWSCWLWQQLPSKMKQNIFVDMPINTAIHIHIYKVKTWKATKNMENFETATPKWPKRTKYRNSKYIGEYSSASEFIINRCSSLIWVKQRLTFSPISYYIIYWNEAECWSKIIDRLFIIEVERFQIQNICVWNSFQFGSISSICHEIWNV